MSTKHSKAAEKFLQDSKMAAWHNETLWMVTLSDAWTSPYRDL